MRNRGESSKSQHTKKVLAGQLMQMLESQSFRKITVNDVCHQAQISRSTFYLHFQDKYALLRYCLEDELQSWEAAAFPETDGKAYLVFVLNKIVQKKRFYYNTLVIEPDREVSDLFHSLFSRIFAARIEKMSGTGYTVPGPVSIVSAFYAGGIVCSTVQWIRNDFDISLEEMAACQGKLLAELAG